jgi:uncharacterized OB-fold protein
MTLIRPSDEYLEMPYWRHLAAGCLHLNVCDDCGAARHPPGPICPKCRSFRNSWRPATGNAMLNSFTEVRHPVHALLTAAVPYIVMLVDLEEGVRLISGIPPGRAVSLRVGMPLRCEVVRFDERFALPYFVPAESDRA